MTVTFVCSSDKSNESPKKETYWLFQAGQNEDANIP